MIRLGLIGCGGMSRNFVSRFHALADRARIVALVDIDRARAETAAGHFPHAAVATDFRETLDHLDAVLIVLPHHLHHPVTKACLQAKKHVLLEKPMANSEAECLDLIDASRQARRTLMIAYNMRYQPLVVRLKEILDSHAYGEPFQISIWTEQYTRYPPGHWALSAKTLGGGQLFSHGCHYVDLLLWCLGRPVQGTHLGGNLGVNWMQREGTSNLSMKFDNGALGYHFGTWGARGTRLRYSIHAHCTGGMLEVDFAKGQIIAHRDKKRLAELDTPGLQPYREMESDVAIESVIFEDKSGKATENEMGHFLDCIENGLRPETDGPRSLQSLRVIWRLYDAERNGVVADLRGLGLDQA